MDKLDAKVISLFEKQADAPEVHQTMRDFVSLAGVFSALGNAKTFDSPLEILVFLRIIQFFNKEALGLSEPIENADTIYYGYLNTYDDMEPPTKKRVEQLVNILITYNWVSKQANRLKMRNTGKRMMDALIRAANDSIAYYMQDEIGRSLFQARRDAEISEAYDDYGISGGNIVASMIRNLNDAIELLQERELELLADRNALPQLELMHTLMLELEIKLNERMEKFKTIEDGLVMGDLIQKSAESLTIGTSLSAGMIGKYFKFISMQSTDIGSKISPEKTRQFIEKMFNPPLESDIPNAHQIFSFMEQDLYEDEAMDGLWIPVKMAPFLSALAIDEGVDYLENYEPQVREEIAVEEPFYNETEMIDASEIDGIYGEAAWMMTKTMIDTDAVEGYLARKKEAELEEVIVESSSADFGDAIRSLMATSALLANHKIDIEPTKATKTLEKEWEWVEDGDKQYSVKRRTDQ